MRLAIAVVVLSACWTLRAAEKTPPRADDGKGWTLISAEVLKRVEAEGKQQPWPGGMTGVAVDRPTGDLWLVVTGHGVWRSKDRGGTFERIDGGTISGRCETGFAINADPAGKRFGLFMLDGKGGLTADGGATWTQFKDVGRNWDYAAVDWSTNGRDIFAYLHESGGKLYTSVDGGKSWKQIGQAPDTAGVGMFDAKTLLHSKAKNSERGYPKNPLGIHRSTDGGQTWARVTDETAVGRLMVVLDGVGYWLAQDGLLVSKDKGATWERRPGKLDGAGWGPWFGKDANHIMVAGKTGFMESTDGGATWASAAPLPALKDFTAQSPGWFLNLAWDHRTDTFYATRMGHGAYRYERK